MPRSLSIQAVREKAEKGMQVAPLMVVQVDQKRRGCINFLGGILVAARKRVKRRIDNVRLV